MKVRAQLRHDTTQDQTPLITRREALMGVTSLGVAAVASPVLADSHQSHEHVHQATMATPATQHRTLVMTTLECVGVGEMCLQHCFNQFAAGDTSLAACAVRNQEMTAACKALASLAAASSAQLTSFAKVCIAIYKACEAECRKHAHHPICIETAEACAKTIAECEKLTA